MSSRFSPAHRLVVLLIAIGVFTTACTESDSWVQETPGSYWSAQYANSANTSYTPITGAQDLQLGWVRSVKGSLGAQPGIGSRDWLVFNSQTETGCSLMEWENSNKGRQRWCTRLYQGGGFSGPLIDQFDNVYVGQPGAILSFPPTQWIRWRTSVLGMPLTPRLLGNGHLLVTTHLGWVQVFHAHRGIPVGGSVMLVDGVDPQDFRRGLGDCEHAGAACPVSAAPAFSPLTGMIILHVWRPGAPAPVIAALKYRPTKNPILSPEWETDAIHAGVIASPVISGNGATVYLNGRDQSLWALNSVDGSVKWSLPLRFLSHTPPALAPDGLMIAGGGPQASLVGIRDRSDHAEQIWRRDDITPLSSPTLAGEHTGYVVAKNSDHTMSLVVFDPQNGATINTYPLWEAHGLPLGIAVDSHRQVIVTTSEGQVFSFLPA